MSTLIITLGQGRTAIRVTIEKAITERINAAGTNRAQITDILNSASFVSCKAGPHVTVRTKGQHARPTDGTALIPDLTDEILTQAHLSAEHLNRPPISAHSMETKRNPYRVNAWNKVNGGLIERHR